MNYLMVWPLFSFSQLAYLNKEAHIKGGIIFTGRGGPSIFDRQSSMFSGPPLAHAKKLRPPYASVQ